MSSGKRKELSKRQEFKEKRRKRQQQQRILTAVIIVGIVLILLGAIVAPNIIRNSKPVGDIVQITTNPRPKAVANTMGDPNAPIKIVEYSDFQCPACLAYQRLTGSALVKEYIETGKAYFVYRSMGQWIGPESVDAAEAAYCAGDQGKFWDYHDILFANQGAENSGAFNQKRLLAFAESINLNMNEFNSCLKSDKFMDDINQDRADGDRLGVTGTPGFLINDEALSTGYSIESFRQVIEAKLDALGN